MVLERNLFKKKAHRHTLRLDVLFQTKKNEHVLGAKTENFSENNS